MIEHAPDRGRLEQIPVVFDGAPQPALAFPEEQRHVVLGGAAVHLERFQPAGLLRDLQWVPVERHDHLEQRGVAQVARGLKLLDQPFERHVLVGIGPEAHVLDSAQQLAKGRVAGQIRAQHEHVDEEADQLLDVGVVAVGDGAADSEVILPAVAAEQHLEGRHQRHEQGHTRATAQVLQSRGQRIG